MIDSNYDDIISKLEDELNAKCAIANKYGIILGSAIKEFSIGKVIPQKILELISDRNDIATVLNLDNITSFALEAKENNYLFTFTEEFILVSKLGLDINLAQFMPGVRSFLKNFSTRLKKPEELEFSTFNFSKELKNLKESLNKDKLNTDKYSIIKILIKEMSD